MKNYGIGTGYRPSYADEFSEKTPGCVQWIEVVSENYMPWTDGRTLTKQLRTLEKLRRNLPIALHGVSMNLGSVDPLDVGHIARMKMLIDQIVPFAVSDHLCFSGVNGNGIHDLLPLPYISEAIDNVVQKIGQAQDILGRRMLIENVSSYLTWKQSEMTEWEFLSEVVKRSDCNILLDINNVYVSSVNHGFDPKEYLRGIPHEKVGQIHLAGHSNENGFLIDTHDEPVCEAVWELLEWYAAKYATLNVMIERDGNFTSWNEHQAELMKIQKTLNQGREHGRHIVEQPAASSL